MDPCPSLLQSLTVVTAVLLLSVTILATGIIPNRKNKRRRKHPVCGTVLDLARNFSRTQHYLTDLSMKHRSFRLLAPFRSMIFTTEPENVEHILKTNFPNYCKGWFQREILSDLLGEGIFTVDGEPWLHQRKVSNHEFHTRALTEHSVEVFSKYGAKLAAIVSQGTTSDQSVDIKDLLMKCGMDSTFKIILDTDLDYMCGTNEEGVQFSNAFNDANLLISLRYSDLFWKIKRFLNIGTEARLRNCVKVVDDFMYTLVRSKIGKKDKLSSEDDVMTRLLASIGTTDPKLSRDIAISFIIAGKDTTTTTLCWFLYMLCRQPILQERIAKEVREATGVGDGSSVNEIADNITEEALNKMHYLHATLSETLRLYPAIPVDGRICDSDDAWPDGFSVSKGDFIMYGAYSMGRMSSLWGDDAEVFRPERWLDPNGAFQHASSFKFIAFNAGPRICLGKEFAYRHMKILSALLVSGFIFRLSEEMGEIKYKSGLTLQIDGGLHLKASPRNNIM